MPSHFADGGERPGAAGPGERSAGAAGPRRGGPEGERAREAGGRCGLSPHTLPLLVRSITPARAQREASEWRPGV